MKHNYVVMWQGNMRTEHATRVPLSTRESPAAFFALTFLLSVPFYVLNALAYLHIVGKPAIGPVYFALITVTPIASAAILTFQARGSRGVKELLKRIFDFKRVADGRWYLPVLFLAPLMHLLVLGGMVSSGAPIPPALTPLVALPVSFPFFFLLAAGEEVGWMGYAFGKMQRRGGALRAALLLGVIWAFWHLPLLVFMMPDPVVLGAQFLTLVGTRVLVAWIFNNTGKSVFAAILFHAAGNTALVALPDINAYAPRGVGTLCSFTLVAAFVASSLWGPLTLARYRSTTAKRSE